MEEITKNSIAADSKKNEAIKKAKPILARVDKARRFASKREDQLKENMAFYQNNPFLLTQYKDKRPWVLQMNTPYASMAIDTRIASLSANDYIGELQPYQQQDAEAVKQIQELYRDAWENAKINTLIDNALGKAAVVREAYAHVILNDEVKKAGKPGAIEAYLLDTMAVLIDPRARDYREAEYIIVTSRISFEEAERSYPEFAAFLTQRTTGRMPFERGENYLENDYTSEQEDILTLFTYYENNGGKITKKVVLEDMLVEEQVISALNRLPIAQLRWKAANQSAYGYALMDDLLSLQKALCSIDSVITNTAVSYAAPQMLLRRQSGINAKMLARTIGAPGVVYETDMPISETLQAITPAKVDDKIVSLKNAFEAAIDKIAGVTSPFIGSIGTAGNTAQGSQLAVERAKIIETAVLTNLSIFVEDLTMIFVDYIKYAYAGEVITSRKKDPNTGKFSFEARSIDKGIKDVDFSFYIDLNTKTQYSKEREKEQLLQLYQMERQYDAPIKLINELDILNRYDLSDKEALNERYKLLSQQTVDNKTATILKLQKAAQQFGIPEQLLAEAIKEVIDGAKETPALDAFMNQAQTMSAQMDKEVAASEEELASQGIQPQFIQQAKQQMAEQGMTPTPENLNLQG